MTDTDRERWRRVGDLFARALELDAAGRERLLADLSGDAELSAELRALLASHERAAKSGFLEEPAAALDPGLLREDSSGTSAIGRSVGPYVIRSQIARGGMGVVFCAEDTRLGRTVALKAIAPELARDERIRERLRREARATATLSHPSIATVYALEESDGELFIASEYVPGRTLREELKDGPLHPARVVETARSVAGALATAHAHGIVHRDLKPENVMRRDDGQIKVLDFGLARSLAIDSSLTRTELTMAGAVLGTPGYMSPEQIRGEPTDRRSDVYSFGVLVHELATGQRPSEGAEAITSANLPSPLAAVIRKCLRPRPEDRFDSGVEVLAALMGSEETSPLPAGALWWWQFHQVAVAIFHAAMLVVLWFSRGWFPAPWGNLLFYAALGVETAAVTMRLHLWFTSRYHRELLALQRARVGGAVVALDAVFAIVLLVAATAAVRGDRPSAPLFVVASIASALALVLIEPATSRAAFGSLDTHS
jgi:hypothetical protein